MFVTTANSLNIPGHAGRMEVIRIAGYTEDEKIEIARQHLRPMPSRNMGRGDGEFGIDDDCYASLSGSTPAKLVYVA